MPHCTLQNQFLSTRTHGKTLFRWLRVHMQMSVRRRHGTQAVAELQAVRSSGLKGFSRLQTKLARVSLSFNQSDNH